MRRPPKAERLEPRRLLSWTISGSVQDAESLIPVLEPLVTGVPGATVYVDANTNGRLDANETSATTDSDGNFSLSGTAPGTYTLREIPPATNHERYSAGESGVRSVTVAAGQTVSGVVFHNDADATISGKFFNDLNGNGVQDAGEPGISSTESFLLSVDFTLSPDIPGVEPDSSGHYTSQPFPPGPYTVYIFPALATSFRDWTITTPPGGSYQLTLSGQNVSGIDFGLRQLAAAGMPAPDLQAGTLTANLPALVDGGETVSGSVAFRNQGNAIALGPMQVSFYAAADPNHLQATDALLGTASVNVNLAPGASTQAPFTLHVPHGLSPGNFYLTAMLNSTGNIPESTDTNNRVVGPAFMIAPSGADLTASFAGSVPLVVGAGQDAQVGVSVGNVGGADFSGSVTVRLYASRNDSLDSGDRLLATADAGHLNIAQGGSTPFTIGFAAPADLSGYYFLIAQVSSPAEPSVSNQANPYIASM